MEDWSKKVVADLMNPRYKLSWSQAIRVRLLRNYLPMFGLMLVIWFIKVDLLGLSFTAEPIQGEVTSMGAPGNLSIWISSAVIVVLYGYLVSVIILAGKAPVDDGELWKENFREIAGFDR